MIRRMAACWHLGLTGILSLLFIGCEVQPKKPEHTGPELTLRMEIHGEYADRLAKEHHAPAVRMWMQPVVGSIYGRAAEGRFADSRIQGYGQFLVSLGDIESALARVARIADSRTLTYFPAATRIARLAVVSSVLGDPDRDYDTTLRDSRTGQVLILVYVDRPCQIRGSLGDNTVDLSLQNRGLYWLEMTHTSEKKEAARLVTLPPEVIIRLDPL